MEKYIIAIVMLMASESFADACRLKTEVVNFHNVGLSNRTKITLTNGDQSISTYLPQYLYENARVSNEGFLRTFQPASDYTTGSDLRGYRVTVIFADKVPVSASIIEINKNTGKIIDSLVCEELK